MVPNSEFVVRGKMRSESRVYFGIRVKHPNGEYAGMFRGDLKNQQPITKIDETGRFEAVYQLKQFTIDPVVVARRGGTPPALMAWYWTVFGCSRTPETRPAWESLMLSYRRPAIEKGDHGKILD